jgi:hypothetical protein
MTKGRGVCVYVCMCVCVCVRAWHHEGVWDKGWFISMLRQQKMALGGGRSLATAFKDWSLVA